MEACDLPDDPAFAPVLLAYFPSPLRERFPGLIARHRLRRELVATTIANEVANRLGCAGLGRLAAAAGPAAVARAGWLAGEGFGLPAMRRCGGCQRRPGRAAARPAAGAAAVAGGCGAGPAGCAAAAMGEALAALRPGIAALVAAMPAGPAAAAWRAAGLPEAAVTLAAAAPRLAAAPAMLRLAAETGTPRRGRRRRLGRGRRRFPDRGAAPGRRRRPRHPAPSARAPGRRCWRISAPPRPGWRRPGCAARRRPMPRWRNWRRRRRWRATWRRSALRRGRWRRSVEPGARAAGPAAAGAAAGDLRQRGRCGLGRAGRLLRRAGQ